MTNTFDDFQFKSDSLVLRAKEAPWDTAAFGCPVGQIDHISVHNLLEAHEHFDIFRKWIDSNKIKLISCRLSSEQLIESMLLEDNEFKFIETVLHPVHSKLHVFKDFIDPELIISVPEESDIPSLQHIAEVAFTNERYYVDPRVSNILSGKRFGRWVINAYSHPRQKLLKVTHQNEIIAFFVVEYLDGNNVYWHLTAVNPLCHGSGYGRRSWMAMLALHSREDMQKVSTTIAARNVPILNLYSSLNFRFAPPEMTFHWVRNGQSIL